MLCELIQVDSRSVNLLKQYHVSLFLLPMMEIMMYLTIVIYWLGHERKVEAHKGMHSLSMSYFGDLPSVCIEVRVQCT